MGLGVGLPLLVFGWAVRVGGGKTISDESGGNADFGGQSPAVIALAAGHEQAVHSVGAIGGVVQEFCRWFHLGGVADDADEFDLVAADIEHAG